MPGWIRERDAASINVETPPVGSRTLSFGRGNASTTKTPVQKKSTSSKDLAQTTIKTHFTKPSAKDKNRTSLSWISSLYAGKGSAGEAYEGNSNLDTEPTKRPKPKRKESPDVFTKNFQQKKPRMEEISPAPSLNLMSVFGQPPQSSLVAQHRTPSYRKVKVMGDQPAPAISPSRRKALFIDSAKDVAVQQHRQWQRSSSPLQVIDNLVGERAKVATPRSSTGLTPSKLRHGYSMIALEDELYPDTENTQYNGTENGEILQEGEGSDEQDGPASPSEERQERAAFTPRLPFIRSPQSNKRIYAQETQQGSASPLQKQRVSLRPFQIPRGRTMEKPNLLDDSDPLSTPPPTSPNIKEVQVIQDDAALRSSPTAAGGSFNITEGPNETESYMSEEDEEGFEKRRDCGDETFKLPTSQDDLDTPIRPFDIKNKLRSNGKSPQKQALLQREREEIAQDSGSETQPLSWNDATDDDEEEDEEIIALGVGRKVSQRVSAAWADVSKVWMEVDLNQGGEEMVPPARKDQRQSSLHNFGFESKILPKEKKAVQVNQNVEFDSDEGVDSDVEDGDDDDDDDAATQILPWNDEEQVVGGGSSPALSMLPSESDMGSEFRLFFDGV